MAYRFTFCEAAGGCWLAMKRRTAGGFMTLREGQTLLDCQQCLWTEHDGAFAAQSADREAERSTKRDEGAGAMIGIVTDYAKERRCRRFSGGQADRRRASDSFEQFACGRKTASSSRGDGVSGSGGREGRVHGNRGRF